MLLHQALAEFDETLLSSLLLILGDQSAACRRSACRVQDTSLGATHVEVMLGTVSYGSLPRAQMSVVLSLEMSTLTRLAPMSSHRPSRSLGFLRSAFHCWSVFFAVFCLVIRTCRVAAWPHAGVAWGGKGQDELHVLVAA